VLASANAGLGGIGMPAHSIGSGTLSFGLVSVPVKMFTAASSASVSFNQLHAKCGGRIKQQVVCPACNEVLDRSALVKGYEFAKDQYVRFTEQELKTLEDAASQSIDIVEFVPLDQVDPIYFEKTYYLGPDKGGAKAYRLLCDVMAATNRVALAKFVMRGKESLVLIRSSQNGLMLHAMYFADEVRDFGEIDKGTDAAIRPGELELAKRLVEELSVSEFRPEQYKDEYRGRVLSVVESKIAGKEITSVGEQVQRTQVIDLMDALKQSLESRASAVAAEGGAAPAAAAERKKPAAKAKGTPAPKESKRASK
jgi:DNA end-binding protein Ku